MPPFGQPTYHSIRLFFSQAFFRRFLKFFLIFFLHKTDHKILCQIGFQTLFLFGFTLTFTTLEVFLFKIKLRAVLLGEHCPLYMVVFLLSTVFRQFKKFFYLFLPHFIKPIINLYITTLLYIIYIRVCILTASG